MGASASIRVGDYKLVDRFSDGKIELFNLKNDLGESKDLSSKFPEIATKLHKKMITWRQETKAIMPKLKKVQQTSSCINGRTFFKSKNIYVYIFNFGRDGRPIGRAAGHLLPANIQ